MARKKNEAALENGTSGAYPEEERSPTGEVEVKDVKRKYTPKAQNGLPLTAFPPREQDETLETWVRKVFAHYARKLKNPELKKCSDMEMEEKVRAAIEVRQAYDKRFFITKLGPTGLPINNPEPLLDKITARAIYMDQMNDIRLGGPYATDPEILLQALDDALEGKPRRQAPVERH